MIYSEMKNKQEAQKVRPLEKKLGEHTSTNITSHKWIHKKFIEKPLHHLKNHVGNPYPERTESNEEDYRQSQ